MLREFIQYIFTKFYFLKFLSPNYYIKMSTSSNENAPSGETASLEAELQKSSLDAQPAAVIDKEMAEKFKEKGNEAFKSTWKHFEICENFFYKTLFLDHDFQKSIVFYTKAIEYDPTNHVYYGNRSFAYVKTELFGIVIIGT